MGPDNTILFVLRKVDANKFTLNLSNKGTDQLIYSVDIYNSIPHILSNVTGCDKLSHSSSAPFRLIQHTFLTQEFEEIGIAVHYLYSTRNTTKGDAVCTCESYTYCLWNGNCVEGKCESRSNSISVFKECATSRVAVISCWYMSNCLWFVFQWRDEVFEWVRIAKFDLLAKCFCNWPVPNCWRVS